MQYDFSGIYIKASKNDEKRAAVLLKKELLLRTGNAPEITDTEKGSPVIKLVSGDFPFLQNKDCYKIELSENKITVFAKGIRGLIFGYSLFLRKCEFKDGKITLTENINGIFAPDKKIRGHQIGYRTTPNTYDAWNYRQYFRYYLDMLAFGANTCEHIPYEKTKSDRNRLMKYDEEDFLVIASAMADAVDMDISLWHPNCDGETEDEAIERRKKLYSRIKRIDAIFPPGGDPGQLPADTFVKRSERTADMLKELHPNAEMWPSAQAPHIYENWGEEFTKALNASDGKIDGVIMAPNHAFPIHELREKTDSKYPLRFYPDITHNLRCEYPVHFTEDDWHFAFSSTISREGVNPRPTEFFKLHSIFSQYTIGSVSYSEGVHDDINKAVWSQLEFNKNVSVRETIEDYVRFFFFGSDTEKLTDCILGLEKNWDCDPLFNPCIKNTYRDFCELKKDYPHLSDNWRFVMLYFRACCDEFVREKREFETKLIKDAKVLLKKHDIAEAKYILSTELPQITLDLRQEIEENGVKLFDMIGLQLDVERFCADGWERGATLDTIDNPVTDRLWLLNRLGYADSLPENEKDDFIDRLLSRNTVKDDETYFSVALHGLDVLGVHQNGEFYMNYQGDRPNVNNGTIPMSMLKVYDHYSFSCKLGGFLPQYDYKLKIIYKEKHLDEVEHFKISANGHTIYEGPYFGGEKDEKFDRELLAPKFLSREYSLPKEIFNNGALRLDITEPLSGFEICEFTIKRA